MACGVIYVDRVSRCSWRGSPCTVGFGLAGAGRYQDRENEPEKMMDFCGTTSQPFWTRTFVASRQMLCGTVSLQISRTLLPERKSSGVRQTLNG